MDYTKEQRFIKSVDELSTGERAALRRCCGQTTQQAGGAALTAFYRALPRSTEPWQEEGYFEGACLRCLWKPEEIMRPMIEEALAAEQSKTDGDALQSRLVALLDTPLDADGYFALKLWRLVKLLMQKGYVIDCAALTYDICRWNAPERYIQKKWARGFYRASVEDSQKTTVLNEEGE